MPKKKNKNNDDFEADIILNKEKRERLLEEEGERDEEIEEGLSEIYRDESGELIDVDKLNIKKKRGVIFWFMNILILGLIAVVLGLGIYYYIQNKGTDSTAVDLFAESQEMVNANEEFFYKLKYRNLSGIALTDVYIKANYPENFIFIESDPAANESNDVWKLARIGPRQWGEIKIKGKIIGKSHESNILLAEMIYVPENFSSEFKKETSFQTTLKDTGVSIDINYPTSALVGEENDILMTLEAMEDNHFNEFELEIIKGTNIRILGLKAEEGAELSLKETEDANWIISELKGEQEVEIGFRALEKIDDEETIGFKFSYLGEGGEKIVFHEEEVVLEIMKSDLNLTMIMNGSQNSEPVDFNEKLNYTIAYANRGEATMRDVVIMAALESDFLDWTTLDDENKGREKGNTITWTKEEVAGLEEIDVGDEGEIDFSINVSSFRESDLGRDFVIRSYAQYDIGELEKLGETSTSSGEEFAEDNRSNTIVSPINSDLSLEESLRYFNEDNVPVGTGPLPPQVGEETTFKVYWTLNNNLHELTDVQVEMELPEYISWAEKNRTSVGSVSYEEDGHKIVWQIGRLPITVYRSDAEFSLAFTPKESDKNKVVVLTTGAEVVAKDADTGDDITRKTLPKTTKLEDDEIASMSSDGRVR
ncbi:hypothetical protein GF382_02900 [Candidatus Falkowbacteria bacterium]|nr:hypothetical protein [Candidatus Falkowbacteria bacterium]